MKPRSKASGGRSVGQRRVLIPWRSVDEVQFTAVEILAWMMCGRECLNNSAGVREGGGLVVDIIGDYLMRAL